MSPMTITPGQRLGPYEILSRIGAGGMGEVWKARDTRLDRSVAIKVLPAALAEDAEFKLRFQREAQTVSQLNHPPPSLACELSASYGEICPDGCERQPVLRNAMVDQAVSGSVG